MDAINKETIDHYFSLLKEVLDTHKLTDHPAQIYNVDESGMPLDFKTPNVVAETGSKKVRYRQSGKKGQVTIVACANAVGQTIPPMIIFDAKNLKHAWTNSEVPGSKYGVSDKGWINTDLFEGWLMEHFVVNAVSGRPLLLLLDGHSTHYQPEVVRFARDHDIIMLCLPPHTTHEAQPLDCGVFKPLKAQWTNVCHLYFQKNPGKVINKFNFNLLFSQAWLKALIPANIVAGFRTCGVYPFNPAAISVPEEPENSNGDEESGGEDGKGDDSGNDDDNGGNDLTNEQCALFQRRFSEGYDLGIDPDYLRWLKIHHPEATPCDSGGAVNGGTVTNGGAAVGGGTIASGGAAIGGGTVASGGAAVGGGTVTSGGATVDGGTVSSGSFSGASSGGTFHNGEPLLDDWEFHDDFTSEQLELFSARLSEGYDQFVDTDYSYICWLEQYHPEALPSDRYSLSVSDLFSSVSPLTPVDNADTPTTSSGSSSRSKDQPPKAISGGSTVKDGTSGKADKNAATIVTSTPSGSAKNVSPGSGASSSTGDSKKCSGNESLMSKHLVDPTAATPSGPKKARPRARLLTSADSLKEMEEKERKKKEEVEEKEKRKKEREEKKKQREEEQKRKAAERAKRAEEKAKKVEEKAKKAEEKAKKAAPAKRPPKRKPAGESSTATRSKKSRVDDTSSGEIDPNTCCTCFVHYDQDETGADWVSCACGRWLHEDCVVDVTIDDEGKERLCPYCLNLLTS